MAFQLYFPVRFYEMEIISYLSGDSKLLRCSELYIAISDWAILLDWGLFIIYMKNTLLAI